jgi:hypothetical protein
MRYSGQRILLLPGIAIAAAVIYAIATLLERLIAYSARVPQDVVFAQSRPGLIILCYAAGIYGLARVGAYHPACRSRYRQWMETVPWRPGTPLPLGPVTLNWRDALMLVPAALLAHYVSGGSAVAPLLAFGGAHLITLAMTQAGAGWWAFALLAGFAGMLRLSDYPLAVAAAMVPLYGVAMGGLHYGLPTLIKPPVDARASLGALGAPFEQLAPTAPPKPVRLYRALAGAALAGWWTYCVTWRVWATTATTLDLVALVVVMGFAVALLRFVVYRAGSNPPLSLAARWHTGRWVIPSYDTVYLTPLVTLATSFATALALIVLGTSPAVTAGITAAVAIWTAILLPPTRARWLLTSPRHIDRRATTGGSAKHVKLA